MWPCVASGYCTELHVLPEGWAPGNLISLESVLPSDTQNRVLSNVVYGLLFNLVNSSGLTVLFFCP